MNPGHEPDAKARFWLVNTARVANRPANPDFWVSNLNRRNRTIQTILRFSTAIQTATTNFRFRRLSGTARGGEIANSDDPTSWIASLSTLVAVVIFFTPSVILTWSKFKMKICFLLSYMFFLQFFTFVSEMLLGKSWLTIFYPSTFLDSGTPWRSSYC